MHYPIRRMTVGSVLMLVGVFVMDPNGIIQRMVGSLFTDHLFQFLLGITIIVIGFVMFTKTFDFPQRTKRRMSQKSEHGIVGIFGLD